MSSVVMETSDRVGILTLNRPEVLNALDEEMAGALHEGLRTMAGTAKLRCVVIRGAGDAFMAGGDIVHFRRLLPRLEAGDTALLRSIFEHVHGVALLLRRMPQPVIAQVHGAVAGFGFSLMLGCDLVLAAENSRFVLAYRDIGVSPDGGATYGLARHAGIKKAMELTLLGERFGAQEALRIGLINRVVPQAELGAAAAEWAHRVATGPGRALARSKQLINKSLERGLTEQLAAEQRSFTECAVEADFAEGVAAFVAKRSAHFNKE
jgi:2-(1,2-epoxy-1,2-dihydrophenyl)acetyl-CoA isomerase